MMIHGLKKIVNSSTVFNACAASLSTVITSEVLAAAPETQNKSAHFQLFPSKLDSKSGDPRKKAVVIGGGVAGVATAYSLCNRGYEVAILEASKSICTGASRAAAGGMQRSNHIVGPNDFKLCLLSLLPSFGDRLDYFRLYPTATFTDPHFWRWFLYFAYTSLIDSGANSSPLSVERRKTMLQFTTWAIDRTIETIQKESLDIGYSQTGAIKLLADDKEVATAKETIFKHHPKGHHAGCLEDKVLIENKEELIGLEPMLAGFGKKFTGGIRDVSASMGDSHRFTVQLEAILREKYHVTVHTETRVDGLELSGSEGRDGREVSAIHTSQGTAAFDPEDQVAVVVAAGAWTPRVTATAGLYVPVYPMKGYDCVIDLPPKEQDGNGGKHGKGGGERPGEKDLPRGIVSDGFMYVSRLGDQIRFATIAEFGGWHRHVRPEVAKLLCDQAADKFAAPPLRPLITTNRVICGFRPFVADGIILCGLVGGFKNLYLNVGPGFNGWKTCIGAGDVIADAIVASNSGGGGGGSGGGGSGFDSFEPKHLAPTADRVTYAPSFTALCQKVWEVLYGSGWSEWKATK